MGWVERLHNKVVGLDTAPLIYFIEDHPGYSQQLAAFFEAVDQGRIRAVTSVITLVEVLARPLREDQSDLADRYREILLGSTGLETVSVSAEIAEQAARLRAAYGLRTPDAIQLAAATQAGAAAFLTNDTTLARISQPEVLVLSKVREA